MIVDKKDKRDFDTISCDKRDFDTISCEIDIIIYFFCSDYERIGMDANIF